MMTNEECVFKQALTTAITTAMVVFITIGIPTTLLMYGAFLLLKEVMYV